MIESWNCPEKRQRSLQRGVVEYSGLCIFSPGIQHVPYQGHLWTMIFLFSGWDMLVPWGVNLPNFQRFIMFAIMYAYTVGIGFWNVISSSCCRSIDFSIVLQVLHVLNCRCRNIYVHIFLAKLFTKQEVSE